jgi:epoxyqueuosine reductase
MSGNEKKRRAAILTGCFWFFGLVTLLVMPLGNKSEGDYVVRGEIEQADHPTEVFEELIVPQYEGPGERQFIFEGICGEAITVNLEGIVNPEKRTIEDTFSVSNEIKGIAKSLGADGVRITRLNPKWVFKGADLTHQYAIVIGEQLPYRYTGPTPFPKQAANLVTQYYKEGGHVALFLAESIRKMGYPARAHYESWSQVLSIPVAIDAGMGELGRNGLLIVPEFGPRGRISVVTTNLPLEVDQPRHLGIQEFCDLCTKCVRYCPANAVPLGGPSVVRGILKWEVDLKKCLSYWYKDPNNYVNCLGCITACPFNKPDRLLHRMGQYLVQRNHLSRYLLMHLDDLLGYGYVYDVKDLEKHTVG